MQPIELLQEFTYAVNQENLQEFFNLNIETVGIVMAFAMGIDLLTFAATKLFQLLRS